MAYRVEVDGVLKAKIQDGPLSPTRSLPSEVFADTDLAWSSERRNAPDGGTALLSRIVPQRSELMMARSPTGWNSGQTRI